MVEYNKGIWKTAALAIAVTLAFAVFVFKFEDWTRDFKSEFVFAQSTGTGGGTGSSGTSVTKIIPQVAVGSCEACASATARAAARRRAAPGRG